MRRTSSGFSTDMFAMQEQSVETPVNSMLLAACNRPVGERRVRPHPTQLLKCPRCDSLNTKFCYYNNYNLAQPRHFCKNCRRYWTKGGVLRNVPVGGGCRKNKRSKPRNPDQPRITSAAKSSSNSTTVSSENSTITANIQETSSSSSSYINIPKADRSLSAYRFDSELQQILSMTDPDRVAETLNACTYSSTTTPECSAIPAPRLFNGLASLDYGLLDFQQLPVQPAKREPEIQNSGNLFSNLDAISRPLNSLISRSNFAGVSVSDLQWKLQQQKLASLLEDGLTNNCIEASSTVDPPSVPSGESRSNNNSNNVFPCDWQTNANNEVLFEDLCCWGGGGLGCADQDPVTYSSIF